MGGLDFCFDNVVPLAFGLPPTHFGADLSWYGLGRKKFASLDWKFGQRNMGRRERGLMEKEENLYQ